MVKKRKFYQPRIHTDQDSPFDVIPAPPPLSFPRRRESRKILTSQQATRLHCVTPWQAKITKKKITDYFFNHSFPLISTHHIKIKIRDPYLCVLCGEIKKDVSNHLSRCIEEEDEGTPNLAFQNS